MCYVAFFKSKAESEHGRRHALLSLLRVWPRSPKFPRFLSLEYSSSSNDFHGDRWQSIDLARDDYAIDKIEDLVLQNVNPNEAFIVNALWPSWLGGEPECSWENVSPSIWEGNKSASNCCIKYFGGDLHNVLTTLANKSPHPVFLSEEFGDVSVEFDSIVVNPFDGGLSDEDRAKDNLYSLLEFLIIASNSSLFNQFNVQFISNGRPDPFYSCSMFHKDHFGFADDVLKIMLRFSEEVDLLKILARSFDEFSTVFDDYMYFSRDLLCRIEALTSADCRRYLEILAENKELIVNTNYLGDEGRELRRGMLDALVGKNDLLGSVRSADSNDVLSAAQKCGLVRVGGDNGWILLSHAEGGRGVLAEFYTVLLNSL